VALWHRNSRGSWRVRVVSLVGIDASDVDRWTDLRSRAITPYPFVDPRLLLPAARHREDAKSMQLLFLEDGGDLLLVMPFAVRRDLGGLPVKVLSSKEPFLALESGWHYPLVDRERAVEALENLFAQMTTRRFPGLLDLTEFPGDGPLAEALLQAAAHRNSPVLERQRLEFAFAEQLADQDNDTPASSTDPSANPSFVVKHSASTTRKRARQVRALERMVGGPLRLDDLRDDPDALEQFFTLQAAGWKGDPSRGGQGLRVTGYDQWFREVSQNYRADGDLRVYALTGGGQLIYMFVSLRVAQGIFGYADAYDERFAAHSAGALGRIAGLNRTLAEPGVEFFDPNMSAHYRESTRLYPQRRTHVRVLLAPGGFAARAAVRTLPAARLLRAKLRGAMDDGS
jgi:hypothetical protein